MTRALTLDDFDATEIAASSKRAALRFVAGMTREKDRPDARDTAVSNWRAAVRLAHRWASVAEIAGATGASPEAISAICESG
ncbi:MAG: hypothetical protein OXC06_13085 [Acidimicrobiaceae bacterium]|nr:hypothetical protein [Acidimicrobiaceae bacterium]